MVRATGSLPSHLYPYVVSYPTVLEVVPASPAALADVVTGETAPTGAGTTG